jgi:cytoskeletal protein CcmA (bactofilin family)
MLKKRRNGANDTPSNLNPVGEEEQKAATPPPPLTPPNAPLSSDRLASAEEITVIGQHISVEGVVRGKENLIIEGEMKGSIELEKHRVTVGPRGKVEAEIHADHVKISGRLKGNIHAHGKVELTKAADFSGEIKAKRISVEDGAYLKAVIELQRESDMKEAPATRPFGQAASGKQMSTQTTSGPKGTS